MAQYVPIELKVGTPDWLIWTQRYKPTGNGVPSVFVVSAEGKEIYKTRGSIGAAYKQEHKELVDSIVARKPIVELRQTAESSLTAVLGRMAAYTGQRVTWDFAKNSALDLMPKNLTMQTAAQFPGHALPGKTKLI